ncbi:hypothetical protein ACFYM2_27670 [Streptomyces sp. NPDC006711]|uniref:hypothetical protein n=1 Tax=Streptomyces sp. NPDC006711 TaxID=3364762 RepID=UPI0036B4A0E8
MTRIRHAGPLLCLLAALTGCSSEPPAAPGAAYGTAGPTATTSAAPAQAARLAERYRTSGGLDEVYGIQQATGSHGAPVVTVWTKNPDGGDFERLRQSVMGFIGREGQVSLKKGYFLDVFGPDGSLRNRYDTTR